MDKGKHMLGVLGDAKENYQRFLEKKKRGHWRQPEALIQLLLYKLYSVTKHRELARPGPPYQTWESSDPKSSAIQAMGKQQQTNT